MDEYRYNRLENRVDEIKEDVSELKADFKVQSNSISNLKDNLVEYTEIVKEHVTGDDKIIKEIKPLFEILPHVKEMTDDYKFKKESIKRRNERIKYWSLRIGIFASLLGITFTFSRIV